MGKKFVRVPAHVRRAPCQREHCEEKDNEQEDDGWCDARLKDTDIKWW